MHCEICSFQNKTLASYCAQCGTAFNQPLRACQSCQAKNPEGAKFCRRCGQSIAPATPIKKQAIASKVSTVKQRHEKAKALILSQLKS